MFLTTLKQEHKRGGAHEKVYFEYYYLWLLVMHIACLT